MYYNCKLTGFLDRPRFDVAVDDSVAVIIFIVNFHNCVDSSHSFFSN